MITFDYIFLSTSGGLLAGFALGWLAYRKRLSDLEFNNEMLLDFSEKLRRETEKLEHQLHLSDEIVDAYCEHLESHQCVFVGKEEEWPDVVC